MYIYRKRCYPVPNYIEYKFIKMQCLVFPPTSIHAHGNKHFPPTFFIWKP